MSASLACSVVTVVVFSGASNAVGPVKDGGLLGVSLSWTRTDALVALVRSSL